MKIGAQNWEVLANNFGDDDANWAGNTVEVFVDESVMMGNKRVGGVRARPARSQYKPSVGDNPSSPQQSTPSHSTVISAYESFQPRSAVSSGFRNYEEDVPLPSEAPDGEPDFGVPA